MLRRKFSAATVCLICAATVLVHLLIARQTERRLERLISRATDFRPILETVEMSSVSRPRELVPIDVSDFRGLRALRASHASLIESDEPADAARPGSDPQKSISTDPPRQTDRPLTRRQQEDLASVRAVIEEEMPETSAEERDIWFDELKSLPAEVVRDLLQVRKQLRVLTPDHPLSGPGQLSPPATPLRAFRELEIPAEPIGQSRPLRNEDWSSTRQALEQAIAWSTHNLANAATPGYKRIEVILGDAYEFGETLTPTAGLGCRIKGLRVDLRSGDAGDYSENVWDLAIEGDGFFILSDPATQQLYYTRCGNFVIAADRTIGWKDGNRNFCLQPRIKLPDEAFDFDVDSNGEIMASLPGEEKAVAIAQLELARFPDGSQIMPVGHGLFMSPPGVTPVRAAPQSPGMGSIRSECLEKSNVNVEQEQARRESLEAMLKTLPSAPLPRTARETGRSPN